jgi:hypothetical protein
MYQRFQSFARWFGAIVIIAQLAACATAQLPEYRQSLFDGINQTNAKTLFLFATVSSGSSAGQYPQLQSQYNEAIAAFDAIRIQVQARGWPATSTLLNRGALQSLCPDDGSGETCSSATEDALVNITDNLMTLRDRHRTTGLAASFVAARKARYETMIGVVLAIENALRP